MKNVKRTILFIFLLLVILTVFSCADKDKKLNIW